jgi:hypothetical protein
MFGGKKERFPGGARKAGKSAQHAKTGAFAKAR